MNFDRGFIKWQPFNSVIPSKTVLNNLSKEKKNDKPILFPEKIEHLNESILEAYYAQNKIKITFYEQNKIKELDTVITKINSHNHTLELKNKKIIFFNQIINIK